MPDIPDEALRAAVRALQGYGWPDGEVTEEQVAALVLEAAAPVLAEHVAQKITAHADRQFPKNDPARRPGKPDVWRTWHRHFGIAARVAANAFYTDEDMKRLAAEALNRGDYIACPSPEDEGHGRD